MSVFQVVVLGQESIGILFVRSHANGEAIRDHVNLWCRGRIAGGHEILSVYERSELYTRPTTRLGVIASTIINRETFVLTNSDT